MIWMSMRTTPKACGQTVVVVVVGVDVDAAIDRGDEEVVSRRGEHLVLTRIEGGLMRVSEMGGSVKGTHREVGLVRLAEEVVEAIEAEEADEGAEAETEEAIEEAEVDEVVCKGGEDDQETKFPVIDG